MIFIALTKKFLEISERRLQRMLETDNDIGTSIPEFTILSIFPTRDRSRAPASFPPGTASGGFRPARRIERIAPQA